MVQYIDVQEMEFGKELEFVVRMFKKNLEVVAVMLYGIAI